MIFVSNNLIVFAYVAFAVVTLLLIFLFIVMPSLISLRIRKRYHPMDVAQNQVYEPREEALNLMASIHTHGVRRDEFVFQEEIGTIKGKKSNGKLYCIADTAIEPNSKWSIIGAEKGLVLGKGTLIEKWVDAEEILHVGESCSLGKRASSGKEIIIHSGTSFMELYAPILKIVGENSKDVEVKKPPTISMNAISISPHLVTFPPYTIFKNDIIVQGNLHLYNGCYVESSIKISGNLSLESDCVVKGNVFADGNIHIGKKCKILGNVFSQGEIIIENETHIGSPGGVKSVIGVTGLVLNPGVMLYGFAKTHKHGIVR